MTGGGCSSRLAQLNGFWHSLAWVTVAARRGCPAGGGAGGSTMSRRRARDASGSGDEHRRGLYLHFTHVSDENSRSC